MFIKLIRGYLLRDHPNTDCCEDMSYRIFRQRCHIGYEPILREYYLQTDNNSILQQIFFCPWCGSKLPKDVREEWFEILEKEYGIEDPDEPEEQKRIPKEFKSNEWWKKRNL